MLSAHKGSQQYGVYETGNGKGRAFVGWEQDKWFGICHRCSLPDCIRNEGDSQPVPWSKKYPGCAIYDGASRGLTPAETLERWREFNLLAED